MTQVTLLRARRVITMDPAVPAATHVAVRAGRILAVGDQDTMAALGPHDVDDRFADRVLIPGLVEGHAHINEANFWSLGPYVGPFSRRDPSGVVHPALRSATDVIDALRAHAASRTDDEGALFAWGPDPLLFDDGSRIDAASLDQVSAVRPVVLRHASGHLMYLNSAAIKRGEVAGRHDLEGILRDPGGEPTGEVRGLRSIVPIIERLVPSLLRPADPSGALLGTAQLARLAGVTTFADMGSLMYLKADGLAATRAITEDDGFPTRLVAIPRPALVDADLEDAVAESRALLGAGNDKLHFGAVKLMADGSIQGFTARLQWPHYYRTGRNGLWDMEPDELARWVRAFHEAGLQIHCHCNGDEAIEVFVDAVEAAVTSSPRRDHRHTVQHGQMMNEAQLRRMAALGMGVNFFSNHLYYWGDVHFETTLGPERAQRMNDCSAALRLGVPFSVHSDAPITPIGPLFSAWCAVNRTTRHGRVLGPQRRISVDEALRAATLGAAHTLKLDHLVGSIEPGKYADFTVLAEDPLAVDEAALKDIEICATVVGGRVFD